MIASSTGIHSRSLSGAIKIVSWTNGMEQRLRGIVSRITKGKQRLLPEMVLSSAPKGTQ
jgi:hypothetical protein